MGDLIWKDSRTPPTNRGLLVSLTPIRLVGKTTDVPLRLTTDAGFHTFWSKREKFLEIGRIRKNAEVPRIHYKKFMKKRKFGNSFWSLSGAI